MSAERELIRVAESMVRNVPSAYGGTLYRAECKEHDWRGRKRNPNNVNVKGFEIRWHCIEDAMRHIKAKHPDCPALVSGEGDR